MRKKCLLFFLVSLSLALFLTACGGSGPSRNIPPTRGLWEGNVYTSEYLGLQLTLPEDWIATPDEEIVASLGLDPDTFLPASVVPEEVFDLPHLTSLTELSVMDPFTGASVMIIFERLEAPISENEYIALAAEALALMGMEITLDFPLTTIGAYEWHSYGSAFEVFDLTIYGRYFVNIQGGFVRAIAISYHEFSESLETLLALFSGI